MNNDSNHTATLHVLVIGGGVGGLAMAQGLKKVGISVAVYERDPSVHSRNQGYRLSINEDGSHSLYACLPANLYNLYMATSTRLAAQTFIALFDHQLNQLFLKAMLTIETDITRIRTGVNRTTLREVLLTGLDKIVHFGKGLEGFERLENGQIRAHFGDGSTATGDLLIGADGTNSMVRKLLLPQAQVVDLGHVVIYGKTPLSPELERAVPLSFLSGITRIMGAEGISLGVGAYRKQEGFAQAIANYRPDARLTEAPDYLMWTLDAPRLQQANATGDLGGLDGASLHTIAQELTQEWHPTLRQLLEGAEVAATFLVSVRSSEEIEARPTTNITLLGDAIHTMTPARGIGANTALQDAALLASKLKAVERREKSLLQAIAEYEAEMLVYGFAAVAASRESADRVHKGASFFGF
jgi:2-polyprenyl-6-methoxyphenol hydroxylase-like FAD-dependent oxidoreductase